MRSSMKSLFAVFTIGAAILAANTAVAGGFSFGGGKGGGNKGGGFKISFGGGNHNHHHHKHHGHHHHKFHHHKFYKYYHYPVKKYYQPVHVVYDQCYEPYYSYCYVYPGDTWYTIAKRCYGHSHLWKHIATYNNLSLSSSSLVPGQQIQLPVVNTDGTLAASNAPAPAPFAGQGSSPNLQGAEVGPQTQGIAPQAESTASAAPAANLRTVSAEPKRPVVTSGSTLELDGELLGSSAGRVRLRISGMMMPVEVLQWSDKSLTIKLPAMELVEATAADLEVLRADGSLASKTAIELMPAATRLALGN